MFPNMDAIGLALARIYDLVERIAIALETLVEIKRAEAARDGLIDRHGVVPSEDSERMAEGQSD